MSVFNANPNRDWMIITFKNSCHSLHGYHKPLNINHSPCNVLVFLMSLMSFWEFEWHQWHGFFLVIARGNIDNQRVVCIMQWVTSVFKPFLKKHHHEFIKRLDASPKTSTNLPQLFFNNLKCFFNFHCYKLFARYHPERKFSTV